MQTNPDMFFCGNKVPVMATGDPFCPQSKRFGPAYGHAFKFKFDTATNHVAAVKRFQPHSEAEVVNWRTAEKLAEEVALWYAGISHPPIYVPGSRIIRVKDRHWHAAELALDGIEIQLIDQDISEAVPSL